MLSRGEPMIVKKKKHLLKKVSLISSCAQNSLIFTLKTDFHAPNSDLSKRFHKDVN